MNNKNYRVMKFFEPINKQNKSRGYVRLDIRGIRGNIIVSVENLGDARTTSEVYLYKDRENKIKLGDINNKKGMLKKILTFGSNNAIEDYNVCAVVKDKKIAMYSNLFNACSQDQIRKLEADDPPNAEENSKNINEPEPEVFKKKGKQTAEPESTINDRADQPKEVKEEKREEKRAESKKEETEYKKAEMEDKKEEVKEDRKEDEEKETKVGEIKKGTTKNKKREIKERNKFEQHNVLKEEKKEKEPVSKNERIKNTTVSSAININEDAVEAQENSDSEETANYEEAQAQANKYKDKFDESLYSVLKGYKQVEPLSVKIKNFGWWYIPYDKTGVKNGFLPYYNQIISSYYPYPMSNRVTTCSRLMEKYGHYIFGIYSEDGDIVKLAYGIPGQFTREEQPYKGITGFKNWSYANKEYKGRYGYWLAFVNPKTGETTDPPQIILS